LNLNSDSSPGLDFISPGDFVDLICFMVAAPLLWIFCTTLHYKQPSVMWCKEKSHQYSHREGEITSISCFIHFLAFISQKTPYNNVGLLLSGIFTDTLLWKNLNSTEGGDQVDSQKEQSQGKTQRSCVAEWLDAALSS